MTDIKTNVITCKVKVKVNVYLYSASSWNTSKALRYGTRSQGISQFTRTPRVHPQTEWTIPVFAFPAEAGTHLPTPEGWKAELALGGWLVTYRNEMSGTGNWTRTRSPISVLTGPDVD